MLIFGPWFLCVRVAEPRAGERPPAGGRRGQSQPLDPAREKWIWVDDQRAHSRLDEACKDLIDIALGTCTQYINLDSEGARRCLHIVRSDLIVGIGRVDKQADDVRRRN